MNIINRSNLKNIMLYVMFVFYIFGGYNHFNNPSFYIPLIPPYLSTWAVELNLISGFAEIALGILLKEVISL